MRRRPLYGVLMLVMAVRIFLAIPSFETSDIGYYRDLEQHLMIEGVMVVEPDLRSDSIYGVIEARALVLRGKVNAWRAVSDVVRGEEESLVEDGSGLHNLIYPVHGKVLLKLRRYPEYEYGDLLRVTGRLVRPGFWGGKGSGTGGGGSASQADSSKAVNGKANGKANANGKAQSYATFLAKDEVFAVMYDPKVQLLRRAEQVDGWGFLYELKAFLKERIETVLPARAAGLAGGVLLGLRRGIQREVIEDFSTVGLTHILAISGYNITLLITLFGCALKSAGRRTRFWCILAGILVFALLTGLSASVVRASLMGALVIFSQFSGRKSVGLRALLISGGLMVFVNPWIVIADISFQLSFLATLGLLVFIPRWESFAQKLPSFIGDALVVTLAAQVFTTPVILMNFERFSIISPLANLLFLPLIPLIMFTSFVALVSSFLWLPWTPLWVGVTWLLSEILIKGVHLLAMVPLASIIVENFSLWMAAVYYGLVGLWLWRRR